MAMRKKMLAVIALLAVFVSDIAFHMMDTADFVGLARFNLMLIAPILAATFEFFQWAWSKQKQAAYAFVIAWIGASIYMSPISVTGEKNPFWASRDNTSAEFYFPKQKIAEWLKKNAPYQNVLVAGAYCDTKLDWYLVKNQCQVYLRRIETNPKIPWIQAASEAISLAEKSGIRTIVFFKMQDGPQIPENMKQIKSYTAAEVVSNKFLSVIIYRNSGTN